MNYSDIILDYEIRFIILIQKIFGSPEDNVNLIKLGKIFTNNDNQSRLIIYAIIINLIKNLTLNNFSIRLILLMFYNLSRVYIVIHLSKFINYQIKNFFKIQRPYLEDHKIKKITIKKDKSKSYSFPSNSIQNSIVFYTLILNLVTDNCNLKNIIVYGIVSTLGFIKTLRGLHYIHDILSGFLLANIILFSIDFMDI
jgi:membrane-associated phospholipid phosphatase